MLKIEIGGISIGLNNRYRHIEYIAKDYLTEEEPLFTVSCTDEEIEQERAVSEEDYPPPYLESVVLYRNIAKQLYKYNAFVFHGAIVALDGKAYAFTARSGVGKTTHTKLWLSLFGDRAHYLNGDKPVIRIIDGQVYACGTPWRGKEGYGVNESLRLGGICFLERGEINEATPISSQDAAMRFISQIYIPKDSLAATGTMQLADTVLSNVPLISLKCNMDIEAARVSSLAFGIKND